MISRTRFALLLGSGVVSTVLLLTGCGADSEDGTNGVAEMPPEKIEASTREAVEAVRAVRLTGTVVSKDRKFRLDMRLKAGGGVGQVTKGGTTFELLRVGKELFLKAGEEFWRHREASDASGGEDGSSPDDAAAEKLDGKYVVVPSGDPAYDQLSGFTDMEVLLQVFLILDGQLDAEGRSKVKGVPTAVLKADGGRGGTVEVALDGKPYPLRYTRPGGGGTLELSDFNEDFALKAPPEKSVVDYGKQISTGGK